MGKFTIKRAKNGFHHYWTLTAHNGEVIATSEMYTSKAAAMHGIHSVKANAGIARIVDESHLHRWV